MLRADLVQVVPAHRLQFLCAHFFYKKHFGALFPRLISFLNYSQTEDGSAFQLRDLALPGIIARISRVLSPNRPNVVPNPYPDPKLVKETNINEIKQYVRPFLLVHVVTFFTSVDENFREFQYAHARKQNAGIPNLVDQRPIVKRQNRLHQRTGATSLFCVQPKSYYVPTCICLFYLLMLL